MKKKICMIIGLILLLAATVFAFLFFKEWNQYKEETQTYLDLSEDYTEQSEEEWNVEHAALHDINSDYVAWIRVPDTLIDFPIVQAADNEKYLNRDFYGDYSSSGCVFVDAFNDMKKDRNIVIYGHNMGSNKTSMFSTLTKYYDPEYAAEHDRIFIDYYEEGLKEYKVFAVLNYNIADDENGTFYYASLKFDDEKYEKFLENILKRSLYQSEYSIDELKEKRMITLSACDRRTYGTNGRCVIYAVEI